MRPKLALPLLPPMDVESPSTLRNREFIHSHHSSPAIINDFILRAVVEKRQDQFASNQPGNTGISVSGYNRYDSIHYAGHPAAAFIGFSRDG
ncbi:MAG: hypothetical protein ABIR18_16040 [Chitinophagaceae bacterium]